MGFLSAWRERRRERAALLHPVPDELWDWAVKEHRIFRWLCPADLARLRSLAAAFLAEKTFDPVGGAVVDEELRVSVAAQACLPLLGLPGGLDWYRDFSTIIVTPREYAVAKRDWDEAGVVHEYDDEFAGEAFELGPVALSAADIEASGWGDGYNVVIHEFAHKLDMKNGAVDGLPPLHSDMDAGGWAAAFEPAFNDFRRRVDHAERVGRELDLDPYASESPAEFFAVLSEYFFELPDLLAAEYPAVYAQMRRFYRQDPLKRLEAFSHDPPTP